MPDPEDRLIRTMTEDPPLRAIAVLMTDTCAEAARRHGLTGLAAVALGRGLMTGMLMATLTKGDERVTVQVLGNGPLGGVTVDANDGGDVRGYVGRLIQMQAAAASERVRLAGLVGSEGELLVHRDLGLKEIYQGHVELWSGEVDEDLERYLIQSEQMDSILRCDVTLDDHGQVAWAGGVLVQTAPGADPAELLRARSGVDAGWVIANLRSDPDPGAALSELVGHEMMLLEWRRVRFHCGCGGDRVTGALAALGPETLAEMVAAGEGAEVVCRFCATPHRVDPSALKEILQRSTSS
jgi:molecular chaperone Hsp33